MAKSYLKPKFWRFLYKSALANIRELYHVWEIQTRYPNVTIESNVQIKSPQNVRLGSGVLIQRNTILHGGGMEWCGYAGGVEIGDGSCISPGCILYGTGATIRIGQNFDCGPGVSIFASRTHYELYTEYPEPNQHLFSDVTIGNNVICYTNAIISPGVTIGDGAVIGAGSVVLRDVEPNTVVVGVPARGIKIRPNREVTNEEQ